MSDSINWGDLYGETGGEEQPIPNGTYTVEITKAAKKFASTGKMMFNLTARIVGGPNDGRAVWNNIVVSPDNPNAMKMFWINLAAFGIDADSWIAAGTDDARAQLFVGSYANFEIKMRTDGQWAGRTEVSKMSKASGATPTSGVPATPTTPAPAAAPVPATAPAAPAVDPIYGAEEAPPAATPAPAVAPPAGPTPGF